MPRVKTQTARKDYPDFGIRKGDVYYSWAFYRSRRCMSKTPPKASQLTGNEALSRMYTIQENAPSELEAASSLEDMQSIVEGYASELREVADDEESKLQNMPEQFQYGTIGEEMQQRVDTCNEVADNLESMDFSKESGEKKKAALERLASEACEFIESLGQ